MHIICFRILRTDSFAFNIYGKYFHNKDMYVCNLRRPLINSETGFIKFQLDFYSLTYFPCICIYDGK